METILVRHAPSPATDASIMGPHTIYRGGNRRGRVMGRYRTSSTIATRQLVPRGLKYG